jgi:hypothetical protein
VSATSKFEIEELNRQDAKFAEEEGKRRERGRDRISFNSFPLLIFLLFAWPLLASWRFNSPIQ